VTDQTDPILLRLPEAARLLGLGRSTIYELASRGEIPTVHIGRAVRISARALHEWAARLEADQRGS
jgi:excisionase family DNA binding protein